MQRRAPAGLRLPSRPHLSTNLRRRPAPAFSVLAKLLVAIWGDDGAWAVTDAVDGGVADRSTPCSLSDISGWRDGVLYPFARGRRRLGRGASRPARAAWLVQRLLTADGDVAGSADSIFAIFGFRPTRDLADRSDRGGADELPGHRQGAASKAQRHRGSTPCSLSDISGWRDGVLYPFARGRRRLGRGASRPARAAWLVRRLLTADGNVAGSADSIFAIFGFRPTRELADRSDRGGADELPGHRQGAASKAQRHRGSVNLIGCKVSRARESAAAITAIDLLDLLVPAVWRCAGGRRRRFFFLVKFRIGANAGARAVTDAG